MIRISHRAAPAVAAVLALAVAAGCAGPQAKVTITGKQVPLNVAFGKPSTKTPTTPTVLVPAPSGVGVIEVPNTPGGNEPPPPSYPGTLPPVRESCPTAPPGSSSPEAAPNSANGVPKAGAATMVRTERSTTGANGTVTRSGFGRLLTGVASTAPNGSTTFQVKLNVFGTESTTEYQTVPPTFAAAAQANTGLISIRFVSGNGGLGYEQSFRPTTPMQVYSQPGYNGATWTSTSTDPLNGSVAQVSGTVVGEEPVGICGGLIDTWRADTVVHVTNATQDIVTTVSTWFATQYGGVPVQQTQSYKGTVGADKEEVSGTTKWTVNNDVWH
jgi:hypothetical protein